MQNLESKYLGKIVFDTQYTNLISKEKIKINFTRMNMHRRKLHTDMNKYFYMYQKIEKYFLLSRKNTYKYV